jgi:hypothetical protein
MRKPRSFMRSAPLIVLATVASACFATEPVKLGELGSEVPDTRDAAMVEDDGSLELPTRDATTAQVEAAAGSMVADAGMLERSEEDHERDAGEREETRATPVDAGSPDAGYAMEAGAETNRDAGSTADASATDAGSDAARSLLCMIEPWHCL